MTQIHFSSKTNEWETPKLFFDAINSEFGGFDIDVCATPMAGVNGRIVKMSPRCLARFQSFPDTYVLPEKPSLAVRGIGNAVPPLMYQRIAETLR